MGAVSAPAPGGESPAGEGVAKGRAPRRRGVRATAGVVALLAVVLVAVLATRAPPNQIGPSALVGHEAPAVSGSTLSGGRASLASLRGRWVLVNFFASWCPPCRTETPELVRFAYSHPSGQKVAVLGVVFGDTAANARAFEASLGATWPAVADPSGRIAVGYGVDDPPQSFLVDPAGKVVARLVGGVTAAGLDRLVATNLGARR